MGEYQTVKLSIEDRAAIVTVDHPPVNAFNSQVFDDMNAAIDEALADEQVKVIIITGAGQFFVAGADINELLFEIERSKKPVIAAINGRACLGGGNELAMACHIRLAEDSVQFGQPEIKLGLIPGWGGTQRLPRLVGKGNALELLLGGGNIKAQEAYRMGLVNKVVPVGTVVREAKRWAKVLSMWSAIPMAAILTAVNEGLEAETMKDAVEIEAQQFAALQASEDMEEGLSAFLEKRRPRFQDK